MITRRFSATKERRNEPRLSLNREFESFDAFIKQYVTNISKTGVFIRSEEVLAVGSPVRLKFTIVKDKLHTIEGIGKVVRVQEAPRGVGVVFVEISRASREVLEELLTGTGERP